MGTKQNISEQTSRIKQCKVKNSLQHRAGEHTNQIQVLRIGQLRLHFTAQRVRSLTAELIIVRGDVTRLRVGKLQ
jgi:hypothetical protein